MPSLSFGRAAIIVYTMPVFSALWGVLLYRLRLSLPKLVGVGGATAGAVLLLWHEFSRLSRGSLGRAHHAGRDRDVGPGNPATAAQRHGRTCAGDRVLDDRDHHCRGADVGMNR